MSDFLLSLLSLSIIGYAMTFCDIKHGTIQDSRRTEFGLIRYYGTNDMIWLKLRSGFWYLLTAMFVILFLVNMAASFVLFLAMLGVK